VIPARRECEAPLRLLSRFSEADAFSVEYLIAEPHGHGRVMGLLCGV